MLTDAAQRLKVEGALDKISDAVEKLCDVWTDQTAPPDDRAYIRLCIDDFSRTKLKLSRVLEDLPLIGP